MFKRRVVVVLVVFLLVLGLVMVGGYASNAMSMPHCYRGVAQVASRDLIKDTSFFLYVGRDEADVRAAFDSVGARYTPLRFKSSEGRRYPCLSVGADRSIPFVFAVRYLFEGAPLVGDGAERSYICIFGWTIDRGQTADIVS